MTTESEITVDGTVPGNGRFIEEIEPPGRLGTVAVDCPSRCNWEVLGVTDTGKENRIVRSTGTDHYTLPERDVESESYKLRVENAGKDPAPVRAKFTHDGEESGVGIECSACSWNDEVRPSGEMAYYCPDCGGRVVVITKEAERPLSDPDVDTRSDKV